MGSDDVSVAVVGAGIGGLTTALALRRLGRDVDVFEAAPELGDVGAGITLAPNAMHGLAFVGAEDEIVASGIEPGTQWVSHWQHGGKLLEVERANVREQYGAPYVFIHRADLQNILADAARSAGIRMHLDKRLTDVAVHGDGVRLSFADGSATGASLLVGADGLKSVVRRLLRPAPAQFTGHIAFRALAPASPEIQHLIDQPGIHIGPGKMVVRYPLRGGSLLNLVFFAREDGWTEEGWSIKAERDELRRLFGDWCDDIGLLISALKPATLHKWAINAHAPLDGWSLGGRVTLIGDAAHAMTPFLGQGAAMAIEDGVVLARALAAEDQAERGLARYEAARMERAHLVQRESQLNADRLQGAEAELYGLGNLRNEETLGLFSYDCTTAPL